MIQAQVHGTGMLTPDDIVDVRENGRFRCSLKSHSRNLLPLL